METQKILYQADRHLSMGKAEEAVTFYDSALTHDRNCYSAWLGKGTALKFLNRYQEALECYERALILNKDSMMAEFLAGYLRHELKKNEVPEPAGSSRKSIEKRIMNLYEQAATNCTVCKKEFPLVHSMTCKKCGQYICYNCYSVQDQNEKSRGWILCDKCAEKMH